MCGHGTKAFEAYSHGQADPALCVTKVENREGKEMEHAIVEKSEATISYDKFCGYLVDVCDYHKVGTKHSIASAVSYLNGRFDVRRITPTSSRGMTRSTTDSVKFLSMRQDPTGPTTPPLPVPDPPRREGHFTIRHNVTLGDIWLLNPNNW